MKKIILSVFVVSSFCLSIFMNLKMEQQLILTNLWFQDIEALAEDEIPEEVKIQCISDGKSVCVVGTFVVINSYYSPH